MSREVERKFLVRGDGWRQHAGAGVRIRQAYLAFGEHAHIRVRIIDAAEARLTIKSASPQVARAEFEYSIPVADAEALLDLRTGRVIEKRRHVLTHNGGPKWEIDVFEGAHEGLVIAEIELGDENMRFERPEWLGEDVSGNPGYYNATLAKE